MPSRSRPQSSTLFDHASTLLSRFLWALVISILGYAAAAALIVYLLVPA